MAALTVQQAELPARQQLEAGSAPIATVLPSVEGGEEVCPSLDSLEPRLSEQLLVRNDTIV